MSRSVFRIALLLALVPGQALAANPRDGLSLRAAPGSGPDSITLTWAGPAEGPFTVYRSIAGAPDAFEANAIGSTSGNTWSDAPPTASLYFYRVTAQPFWKRDVTNAPVDPQSATILANLAAAGGFGSGQMRIDFSIQVLHADASAPMRTFTPTDDFYSPDCDHVPVPVPAGGALEGESGYSCASDGDCHLIVLHEPTNLLYEMWRADLTNDVFRGGCLAVWDLNRIYPPTGRGDQCTSADAAGFPIAPLLFSADELAAGSIDHAIRFILPNSRMEAGVYVRPATHAGGPSGHGMPPYGARLRLRANYPLTSLSDEGGRIIARALQRYGMLLADGGTIALTAQNDRFTAAKWSAVLPSGSYALGNLTVGDFEIVDAGPRIPLTYDCVRNP